MVSGGKHSKGEEEGEILGKVNVLDVWIKADISYTVGMSTCYIWNALSYPLICTEGTEIP